MLESAQVEASPRVIVDSIHIIHLADLFSNRKTKSSYNDYDAGIVVQKNAAIPDCC
jgi:hypothetical protein